MNVVLVVEFSNCKFMEDRAVKAGTIQFTAGEYIKKKHVGYPGK